MQLLKNIFAVLSAKERQQFFFLLVIDIIISIADILFLITLLLLANHFSGYATPNNFIYKTLQDNPLLISISFLLLFVIKNVSAIFHSQKQNEFIYQIAANLSDGKVSDYFKKDYQDYVTTDSAVHLRAIGQQPIEFSHYVLRSLQQLFSQMALVFISIIAILLYNPEMFALLLAFLLPAVITAGLLIKRKSGKIRMATKATSERSIQRLKEALASFIESRFFDKSDFFRKRYGEDQQALNHYLSEQQSIQNIPARLIEIFAIAGFFILVLYNRYAADGTISLLTLGAFLAAAYKIIPGLVKIMNSISQIKTYSFSIDGLSSRVLKETIQLQPIDSIQFKDVSFSFQKEPLLSNFSLTINKGDFVGINSLSGKGKTTIINLLLGLLTPDKGTILINGNPVSSSTTPDVSYIKQQSFLLHDSLLKNITLSENHTDHNKINDLIRITGLEEFVSNSSEGIHTIIREEGKNFSGGQRQRIILARSLYKETNTIILDEPFNELDRRSEEKLLEYLKAENEKGKTILLITHNLEAFKFCNKKIVIE